MATILRMTKNAKCIDYIEKGYKAVIPIYFYYDNGTLNAPSSMSDSILKKKIRRLNRKTFVMEPIVFTVYPSVK